jgi:hypothetical protein
MLVKSRYVEIQLLTNLAQSMNENGKKYKYMKEMYNSARWGKWSGKKTHKQYARHHHKNGGK